MTLKILFFGDVVGRSGREALKRYLPNFKKEFSPDCIIVNGENAAHGFGITPSICKEFYELGVHVITTGNHIWDQKEIISHITQDPNLLRPLNFPSKTPGRGWAVFKTPSGHKILVVNLMGRLFMDALDDPFQTIVALLETVTLGQDVQAIIVDMHAEATSEKIGMAYFLDGRVSAVLGTHTHVPTADQRILPKGTAFQSDVGMCGDYDSIVGMDIDVPLYRFTRRMPAPRKMEPAQGEGTLCGVLLEIDPLSGQTRKIQPIQRGGVLAGRG